MCEFFKWLVHPDNINANIFGLITVILSGGLSWIISALYFQKGNRDTLRATILHPMKRILNDSYSWNNYKALSDLYKDYGTKYLKDEERAIIDSLLEAYKKVCSYNYEFVCAESLFSYFKYKLEQKGIDTKPVPIYIDDELVDVDFPPDLLYIRDDLARVVRDYPPEHDEQNCKDRIIVLFNEYKTSCYTNEEITFFDDCALNDVLKKARNRIEWNEKFNTIKDAKQKFLSMKVLK